MACTQILLIDLSEVWILRYSDVLLIVQQELLLQLAGGQAGEITKTRDNSKIFQRQIFN